jgi:hypothetical protein
MHNLYDIDTNDPAFFEAESGDNFDSSITPADYKPFWMAPSVETLCMKGLQTAVCEICGTIETDIPEHLEKGGWLLLNHEEFCQKCRW